MTEEYPDRPFGYVIRGRNRNAWCVVEARITAGTRTSVLIWPSALPDVECWVPRRLCQHGDKLCNGTSVQFINIREWFFKEVLAMAKQKRGTFEQSQSQHRDYVTLHGDIIQCTEKAILFVSREEPDMESWIPKSQCEGGDELGEDDNVDIHVSKWFVQKEDLK